MKKWLTLLFVLAVCATSCSFPGSDSDETSETELTVYTLGIAMNPNFATTRIAQELPEIGKPVYGDSSEGIVYLTDQSDGSVLHKISSSGEYLETISLTENPLKKPGPIAVDETIWAMDHSAGVLKEYDKQGPFLRELPLTLSYKEFKSIPVECVDVERIEGTLYLSIRSSIDAIGKVDLGGDGKVEILAEPWIGYLSSYEQFLYATNFLENAQIESTEGEKESVVNGIAGENHLFRLENGEMIKVADFLPKYMPGDFIVDESGIFVAAGSRHTLDHMDREGTYVDTLGNWNREEKLSPQFAQVIRPETDCYFVVFQDVNRILAVHPQE